MWLLRNNQKIWKKIGGKNNLYLYRKKRRNGSTSLITQLPSIISIEFENIGHLIQAISSIRKLILMPRKQKIDFSTIKYLKPGGALVLAAEIDRYRIKRRACLKPWKYNCWHTDVKLMLHRFGLFKLLDIPRKINIDDEYGNVVYLSLKRGEKANGSEALKFREEVENVLGIKLSTQPWFIAITEAMTNVAQHAYPLPLPKNSIYLPQTWWLSGAYDKVDKSLRIMFYDQGLTIPGTLPKSKLWTIIQKIALNSTEGEQIKAAFQVGKSQTGESHRGKGVGQLLEPIKNCQKATLTLISGRGYYRKTNINDGQAKEFVADLPVSLNGTYIEWIIYVNERIKND